MRQVQIYKITHTETGKLYIGQTGQTNGVIRRWRDHQKKARNGSGAPLHVAIRLYGVSAFQLTNLMTCDPELADFYEMVAIRAVIGWNPAMCLNVGAGGSNGNNSRAESTRLKISRAQVGSVRGPLPEATRLKISQRKLGVPRTRETIRKMTEARRAHSKLSPEWRANISEGLRSVAKFKLSDTTLADLLGDLGTADDATLCERYGVSRKMLWRIRKGKHRKANELLCGKHATGGIKC